MEPNKKAIELYEKMWDIYQHDGIAIECAIVSVDEIINTGIHLDYIRVGAHMLSLVEFYTEVKVELNKLY
tara:strand:+ start:4323 stop:4532 length:210 start_codon:yes stop_codon:yes gene_type:complete